MGKGAKTASGGWKGEGVENTQLTEGENRY